MFSVTLIVFYKPSNNNEVYTKNEGNYLTKYPFKYLVRNEQNCGGGNFSCKQCIVLFSIVTGRSRIVYPFSYLLSVGLEILARALLGEFRERLLARLSKLA